jgi:hypothetical protein
VWSHEELPVILQITLPLWMQVRTRMVNSIKEVIKQLSEFKPGTSAKRRELGSKLAKTVEALIQDVLIELKYSVKLLPEVCGFVFHATCIEWCFNWLA